jgi:hypothetical protein
MTAPRRAPRPDNVTFAPPTDGPNHFTARVQIQHYQGTQTVYGIAVLSTTVEALEIGSSARRAWVRR